jgi:hypothetical protein
LLPLVEECRGLRVEVEVKDREIKKIMQVNENRKQSKKRLKA